MIRRKPAHHLLGLKEHLHLFDLAVDRAPIAQNEVKRLFVTISRFDTFLVPRGRAFSHRRSNRSPIRQRCAFPARSWRDTPPLADERVAATRGYLEYAIMPLWFLAGVADYVCHRRSKIETTSGVVESFLHSLMMIQGGIPVLAGLFLEANAGVLGLSLAALAAHRANAMIDVAYAVKETLSDA